MREVDQPRRAPEGAAGHTARATHGRRARSAALLLIVSGGFAGCGDLDGLAGPSSAPPAAPLSSAAREPLGNAGRVIPGQYIVVFTDDVHDAPGLARRMVAEHGGELTFSYTSAIKGFAARLPERALEALRRNPHVAAVEVDVAVAPDGTQLAPRSWGLDRIDQTALPLDQTYTTPNDGAGVNIYIIDSGIRPSHQEFGGRVRSGFTAINDGNGTNDCYFHGTHVAGIAAGGTIGVAKGATLWAVRVFDCSGSATSSGVIAAVDWVTRNHVRPAVANMSLSGPVSSALNTAVANSIAAGVVYTVSAGNAAVDACRYSPASLPAALTVGAVSSADAQTSVSNWGSCLDLYAPGQNIISASLSGDANYSSGSGTSAAAPHAAGVAALILAGTPDATPAQVAERIVGHATTNVLSGLGVGSPNRLLHVGAAGAAAPPPPAPQPPPEPAPVTDQPPTAGVSGSCPGARVKCSFDGSGSSDDLGIVSYTWSFGDGSAPVTTGSSKTAYTYQSTGTYTVTLTVRDGVGQSASASRTVRVKKL